MLVRAPRRRSTSVLRAATAAARRVGRLPAVLQRMKDLGLRGRRRRCSLAIIVGQIWRRALRSGIHAG